MKASWRKYQFSSTRITRLILKLQKKRPFQREREHHLLNPPILDSGEKKLLSTGYMHREVMYDFHQYWNHIGIYKTIEKNGVGESLFGGYMF